MVWTGIDIEEEPPAAEPLATGLQQDLQDDGGEGRIHRIRQRRTSSTDKSEQ